MQIHSPTSSLWDVSKPSLCIYLVKAELVEHPGGCLRLCECVCVKEGATEDKCCPICFSSVLQPLSASLRQQSHSQQGEQPPVLPDTLTSTKQTGYLWGCLSTPLPLACLPVCSSCLPSELTFTPVSVPGCNLVELSTCKLLASRSLPPFLFSFFLCVCVCWH